MLQGLLRCQASRILFYVLSETSMFIDCTQSEECQGKGVDVRSTGHEFRWTTSSRTTSKWRLLYYSLGLIRTSTSARTEDSISLRSGDGIPRMCWNTDPIIGSLALPPNYLYPEEDSIIRTWTMIQFTKSLGTNNNFIQANIIGTFGDFSECYPVLQTVWRLIPSPSISSSYR